MIKRVFQPSLPVILKRNRGVTKNTMCVMNIKAILWSRVNHLRQMTHTTEIANFPPLPDNILLCLETNVLEHSAKKANLHLNIPRLTH